MNNEKIKQLVAKYTEGQTSLEEERKLRRYFGKENIPNELQPYAEQFRYYNEMRQSGAPADFDPFAKIDFEEESDQLAAASVTDQKSRVLFDPAQKNGFSWWAGRIAAGFLLLLIGYGANELLNDNDYASTQQVAQLEKEVQQMKDALMATSDYETASAGERLSAVSMSTRYANQESLDRQITDILVYTMNNDKNVNVRLAAAEALFRYREELRIQKALVNGLNQQSDPLMQITLIDMLVKLKASGAVTEMEKLLVDADTEDIVRERLQAGIAELKV